MSDLVPIQRKIYEIRGQKVILDRDLAALYLVETRVLNQAVKRNLERFPEDFMFQLTSQEWNTLRLQIATSLENKDIGNEEIADLTSQIVISSGYGGHRHLPYAFTEHGVVMLASLLRSETAVAMSVQITRAFVAMRRTIAALASTESKIELLNERVERLNMYIEEILRDQNDINEEQRTINEETGMQLELINQSLAELQAKPKEKPRKRIGFDARDDEWI